MYISIHPVGGGGGGGAEGLQPPSKSKLKKIEIS